jgi:DNA-directed RNA polymerase specialized sigma24 family protein
MGFIRNGCRHAIANYRKSLIPSLESDPQQPEDHEDGFEELILSLPSELRKTAELLAQGLNHTETADELGVSRREVFRHREQLRGILGFDLFCRWIARCFA